MAVLINLDFSLFQDGVSSLEIRWPRPILQNILRKNRWEGLLHADGKTAATL